MFDRRRAPMASGLRPTSQVNAYRLGRKDKKRARAKPRHLRDQFLQALPHAAGRHPRLHLHGGGPNGILVLELNRLIPTRRKS